MRKRSADLSKKLHESIYLKLDAITGAISNASMGIPSGDPELDQVARRHTTIWMKEYGPGCAWKYGGISAIGALGFFGGVIADQKWIALAGFLGALTIATIEGIRDYYKNLRSATAEELANLMPALKLTPVEQAYCEALIEMHTGSSIGDDQRNEVLAQMNKLMDDAVLLNQHRKSLTDTVGSSEGTKELDSERADLQQKLEATSDPEARRSLQTALAICEDRLSAAEGVRPRLERVNAQLDVILQTMRGIGGAAARAKSAPVSVDLMNLDGIRQNVSEVHAQTRSIEEAIEELSIRPL